MQLSLLLKDIVPLPASADRDVLRLQLDSRQVKKNDLFLAVKGIAQDGRAYIADAIARGASAVLLEADASGEAVSMQDGVPLVLVHELKSRLGLLAARFYHDPAKQLHLIGVTGTNGKTSCTHFLAQALERPCGIIGTLGSGLYGQLGEAGLTTPDPVTLQATLRQFVDQAVDAVAMEVSSHSIDQGRVNGLTFEIGMFTNLTQDHLDYHGTMDAYAAVKHRFLAQPATKQVIINADDAYGRSWLASFARQKPVYAYASQFIDTTVPLTYAKEVELSLKGIRAAVHSPWGSGELFTPLVGAFNLSNVLATLTALCVYGVPFKEALSRMALLKPVPGRMQAVHSHGSPLVVVDYAHTPDALEKVLEALRSVTTGQLFCVFGCGGDRDAGKRPQMAAIAERLSDQIIVTNDNPRHEKPEEIARQIMQGFKQPDRVSVVLDRAKAIQNSIQWSTANDCVLIAGKGAEHYQQIGDQKTHFDDVEEVRKYIAEKLNVTVAK